jgi:hypothetical protein
MRIEGHHEMRETLGNVGATPSRGSHCEERRLL